MEKYEIMLMNDKIYMTDHYELTQIENAMFIKYVDVRESKFQYIVPLNSVLYIKERQ